VLRSILDDAAAGKLGAAEPVKKIGDYYGACMDDAGIEKKGRKAIQPLLTKASKVRDPKSWFAMLLELHKVGDDAVWQVSAQPDFVNSSMNVLWMEAGGLTLPDRDYYVEASFKDKLDAYRAHLVRMFGLLGRKPAAAAAAAADVLRIETELAKVTKTGVEARVIKDMYNPKTLDELKGLSASVDWKAYFKGLGVAAPASVIVGTPKFFQALDGLRKTQKPAAWQAYFTYRVIAGNAFAVGKRFDDEMFALRQALTGVKAPRERYKRCIDGVDGALPEYLGPAFVERSFPGTSKAAANALIDALFASMETQIGKLDWMSAATRPPPRPSSPSSSV
jgi:putative endopeptidase